MSYSNAFSSISFERSITKTDEKCYVVCVHGFLGAPWNMHFLAKNLRKGPWHINSWKYSSRKHTISEHGASLAQHLKKLARKKIGKPIHFVAHSMGGLVVLAALNHPSCPKEAKIGKVVLMVPPLKGSYWARWLGQFSPVRWFLKDFSGRELITESDFERLGHYPDSLEGILVISGSLGWNFLLKEKNDGTLSICETFLSQPHEHTVVKCGHKTILFSKKVCRLISKFFLTHDSYLSSRCLEIGWTDLRTFET